MMIEKKSYLLCLLLIILSFYSCSNRDDIKINKEDYLGQNFPGLVPELFAPGIVSTKNYENSITISPDGKEIYWAVASSSAGRSSLFVIVFVKFDGNNWSMPNIASFSGKYADCFPCFSPDGNKLYFSSHRPSANKSFSRDWNIWVVERDGDEWFAPDILNEKINTHGSETSPSITQNNILYFKRSGDGASNIYRAILSEGEFEDPEKLGNAINSETSEAHPFIAPDESYLLFSSWKRQDGFGEADIYVSFKNKDGNWKKSINMGNTINSDRYEGVATISSDGNYLFFTKNEDIYWVDAKIIEELKPKKIE